MRKKWIKPLVLAGVFVIALVISSILTNASNEDLTTSMPEATLPVLTLSFQDTPVNELHGYVREMDVTKMRDTITPVDKERTLPVVIDSYGMEIDVISYEIRSIDGTRLMAEGESTDFAVDGNQYRTSLKLQNILTDGVEYVMTFTLGAGQEEILYYTRIMQTEEFHAKECLAFVREFHEYTFRDDAAEFIPTYMDPATGDATTLAYVDLSCTLKQITWADFTGFVLNEPVASFKEINSSYNVLTLSYVMTAVGPEGESEFYNVEEYYRLRRAETRIYVLNFERTMHQIFRGENNFVSDAYNILLGIRDPQVEYQTTDAGNIISFVQEGELWCYHVSDNTLVQVFSFLSPEGIDPRENWTQHDIKIIRMDEAGSVDFMVCGYMNRGDHEGEVGMGVYHYDGIAHTVEEEAFVPTTESYGILKAELGRLMYENEQGIAYLMMQGTVYELDMGTLEVRRLVEGLRGGSYAVSDSNRYFAWVDAEAADSSDTIHLMDLRSGSVSDITDGTDKYLRPLGFLEEDFIYGAADRQQVSVNAAGKTDFPMEYVRILGLSDSGHELLKEYSKAGRYIGGIAIDQAAITVHLLRNDDGQYIAAGIDSIMNKEAEKEERVMIRQIVTEEKETQVVISQSATLSGSKVKLITPKSVIHGEERIPDIATVTDQSRFYAYRKGEVLSASDAVVTAIEAADSVQGIVVDEKQEYVWKRARKNAVTGLTDVLPSDADSGASSIARCISALLSSAGLQANVGERLDGGMTPREVLADAVGESGLVVDLTGCSVEETLYYISCGVPVFALSGTEHAVLLVGYDAENITYFDPMTNAKETIGYEDADTLFAKSGSVYFSVIKR